MANETNKNKLDDKLKESLSKYEASAGTSNWSRMESMLNDAPKAGTSKWSYLIGASIGIVVLAGSYLYYTHSKTAEILEKKDALNTQQQINSNSNIATPTPATTVNSVSVEEENKTQSLENASVKNDKPLVKEDFKTEKINNKTEENKLEVNAVEKSKNNGKAQQIMIMGKDPLFGDMLDSSKGIIGATKEKEETKKAAKIRSEKPINWDKFINADSLNKIKEEHLKDSMNASPQD